MNIVAPTNDYREVESLVSAGANELYLGFLPKNLSPVASINRRYFQESNFNNFHDINLAVKIAHSYDVPVSLTLNSPYYTKPQYRLLRKILKKSMNSNIDCLIVADLGLLLLLKQLKYPFKVIISTVSPTFNSETALFYNQLGASRIILPRQISLKEISNISRAKLELESFMLFDLCRNIDGFCHFHHGIENILNCEHACTLLNNYRLNSKTTEDKQRVINGRIRSVNFNNFCGACHLKELKKAGVNYVKIAGRRFPTHIKIKAISFIKQSLELKNQDQIQSLYIETFDNQCPVNCNFY